MTDDITLLPCPMCGKTDLDHNDYLHADGVMRVRCAWCHCEAPESAWNRRAAVEAAKPAIIARFLAETGQYVTNDATRQAAIDAAVEADRRGRMPSAPQDLLDMLDTLCAGLEWNIENHPAIMNESDSEALAEARALLSHYGGGQPAASAEPRPDEYDYFVDWYDKDAPDEHEASNFDMARHAWLAGVRFADLFPASAPVAQEPVQGEKFLRAWVNLDELPGGMMIGPGGRFGPVPASTSCWITTSEREAERMRAEGPVMEVWAQSAPVAAQAQQVDVIAVIDSMPDGKKGFLVSWGLMQFANAVLKAAQAQLQQSENQEALADTQRAIIEAAERRGYERAMAECAQDLEDAERYRWLRPFGVAGLSDAQSFLQCQMVDGNTDHGRMMDAAIDAARAKGE